MLCNAYLFRKIAVLNKNFIRFFYASSLLKFTVETKIEGISVKKFRQRIGDRLSSFDTVVQWRRQTWARELSPQNLAYPRTVKHTGQESGGELCKILKF